MARFSYVQTLQTMCVVISAHSTGRSFAWWLSGCGGNTQTRQTSQRYIICRLFTAEDFRAAWKSVDQVSPLLNVAKRAVLELPWPPRWVLDISCVWLCGLIRSCSGVCRSDIVIMFSNRGTFQALCWLLIGLQCNDCVILMTQIQLIVIFMSYEDCLFLSGTAFAEVYVCVCVCVCVWENA